MTSVLITTGQRTNRSSSRPSEDKSIVISSQANNKRIVISTEAKNKPIVISTERSEVEKTAFGASPIHQTGNKIRLALTSCPMLQSVAL
jgi:hypothetical protein